MPRTIGAKNKGLTKATFKPYTQDVIKETLYYIATQIQENKVSEQEKETILNLWHKMKKILDA